MVLVLIPFPNKLRSLKILSIRQGCARFIVPSYFLSILTPRKSSRVFSSMISNLALCISLSISSISVGSGPAKM